MKKIILFLCLVVSFGLCPQKGYTQEKGCIMQEPHGPYPDTLVSPKKLTILILNNRDVVEEATVRFEIKGKFYKGITNEDGLATIFVDDFEDDIFYSFYIQSKEKDTIMLHKMIFDYAVTIDIDIK